MKPLFVVAIALTALFALSGNKCETNYSTPQTEPQKQEQPAPQPSEQPQPVTPSQ